MPYKRGSPKDVAQRRDYHKRYYQHFRSVLYELLGGVCIGCRHADRRVLEFDHINDDGAADRKLFRGSRSMLEWYARHPEVALKRLQILCRNCNWLKRNGHQWGGPTPKSGGRMLDGVAWHQFPDDAP